MRYSAKLNTPDEASGRAAMSNRGCTGDASEREEARPTAQTMRTHILDIQ